MAGLVILVVIGVLLWQFLPRDQPALPREVSVADASLYDREELLFLDVREQFEWNEGHIPGAVLIPLGELAGRLNELPRDQKILVVCRSGNRSAQGRDILLQAGFEDVTSLAKGMTAWASAGNPVVIGP